MLNASKLSGKEKLKGKIYPILGWEKMFQLLPKYFKCFVTWNTGSVKYKIKSYFKVKRLNVSFWNTSMENFHKFWYSQLSFKNIYSNFFQRKTIPYQDFILTRTYSWAVILLQVDVNKVCSIFHQQLFQDSELPGGKKIQTEKTSRFPVKCSSVTVVKLAIATPAYIWKDGPFLFKENSSFQKRL